MAALAVALAAVGPVLVTPQASYAAENEDIPAKRAADGLLGGGPIVYDPPPSFRHEARTCSPRVPLCVRSERTVPGTTILAVLASAERAYSTLTGALDLPAPDVDPDTLAYDVFLAEGETARTTLAARDVRSNVDRARSFTVLDARVRPGCSLDATMARELARAALFRSAPATDRASAIAQATYLSHLVAPCGVALEADAVAEFQGHPDRAITDPNAGEVAPEIATWSWPPSRTSELHMRGAALFWSRLDWAFGRNPGGIVRATWALAPSITPLNAPRWHDEPDVFDVLRFTFKNALSTGSTIADLMLDFAVARAFIGSSDDGFHQPEWRSVGEAGAVRLDWDIPWPHTPARFAPRAAPAPTGSSYLLIHRDGAPKGSRLRAEIEWEQHALFRWAFVKLDKDGRELGRNVIATSERATEAQMTLVDLDDADRVLVVGVNTGDPAFPFDPNDEVWEPHGWLVTLASEDSAH
ncbi:hypothetical protein AKJ09_01166 [Labilithrix luteola]|uniref:Uncharacterized protein n=1 Tax=Labilithrix luteola TaxID=1391654 RepID=A0A0K1PLV4_9BACT|nr:hypothetical protein AKJ09_01166 [Labilithrix luteola]